MAIDISEEYDKIYRYCCFRISDIQTAEDLTQETFLKYYSQSSYRDKGKPMAYLYTIARNLCIDEYRRKKPEMLSEEVEAKNQIEKLELSMAVRQVLKALPQEEQEILILKYVNDVPTADIAEITGLSRFAVYRKAQKALAALKKVLREEDIYG